MWVLALLNSPPPSFAAWHGQRERGAALCVASDSEAAASEAAQNILKMPRPTTGEEAFRGTVWQVLFEMDEGGSALFTVEMMSDYKCRFSDKDENGASPWLLSSTSIEMASSGLVHPPQNVCACTPSAGATHPCSAGSRLFLFTSSLC